MAKEIRRPVVTQLGRTRGQLNLSAPSEARSIGVERERNVLLQKKRYRLRMGVDKGPKGDLIKRLLRESHTLLSGRSKQAATLVCKKALLGEKQPQMATLPAPSLQIPLIGGLPLQHFGPEGLKLQAILLGYIKRRGLRVNAEAEMNHILRREESAFRRRDEISQMHGRIQMGINGARGLGTERILLLVHAERSALHMGKSAHIVAYQTTL